MGAPKTMGLMIIHRTHTSHVYLLPHSGVYMLFRLFFHGAIVRIRSHANSSMLNRRKCHDP